MTDFTPFEALKNGRSIDFAFNVNPICPHCGTVADIHERELWELYEEGDHEIECGHCEREFRVETNVSFSFSTEEQDGFDD